MGYLAVSFEVVAALHVYSAIDTVINVIGLHGGPTHVIRQVVMVWKIRASQAKMAAVKAPILRQMPPNRPTKNEQTAKNRPMMMNGNMNRDVRK